MGIFLSATEWMNGAQQIAQFVSTAVTPIVAIALVRLAYKQHKANDLKIRADLYDRRMAIFNAVTDLIAAAAGGAALEFDQLRIFLQKTRESYFLFGQEIPDYLDQLYRAGVDFRQQNKKLASNLPVGQERSALAEANGELAKWFSDQFDISQKKFAPYLRLT